MKYPLLYVFLFNMQIYSNITKIDYLNISLKSFKLYLLEAMTEESET